MALQSKIFSAGDLAYQSWSKSYAIDLIITEESTSVENNTSAVSYRLQLRSGANNRFNDWPIDYSVTINGSVVASGRPSVNQPYNHTTVLASGSFSVPHEEDGSKYLVVKAFINSQNVKPYLPPRIEIDEGMQLTYIPRASRVSCTDGYIGGTGSLTIQSASNQFVHTIMCQFKNLVYWVGANGDWHNGPEYISGGTIPFTFINSMYEQIPNERAAEGTIRCITYLASDHSREIGTTYANFTAMTLEERCHPIISGAVEDANPQTIALTGDKHLLVRYYSTALCSANLEIRNSATAQIAIIRSMSLLSGSVSIPNVEDGAFHFFVQDSRGYRGYNTVTKYLVPYVKLTNNAEAKRTEPTSGNVTLRFSGDYYNGSFGKVQNTITLKYKLSTEQDYKTAEAVVEGNKYTATVQMSGLDYQRVFQIETVVSDQLVSVPKTLTVHKGLPVFEWDEEFFRFHVPVSGQFFEPRGHCGNADEERVSGVYHVVEASTNVPSEAGVLLVFNIYYGYSVSATVQVFISADANIRKIRMLWWGAISEWKDL